MPVSDSTRSISERYQQIQALTPNEETADLTGQPVVPISTFLSLSLFIFFFVVIFLGFLPLVIERFRDFKRFQMALLLAFVGAALPLTMGLLFQRSGLLTRAAIEETPQNVRIVTSENTIRASWETTGDQFGALRYGTEPYRKALTKTVLEIGGLERTKEHEVVVKNLEPETDYYFEILSGAGWYDNKGALLHVLTPAK